MSDMEIVSALAVCLADKIGQERFDLWLGQARFTIRGEAVAVEVPNRFTLDWVRSHYRGEIESACTATFGKPMAAEFRVDSSLAASGGEPKRMRRAAASGDDPAQQRLEFDGGGVALADDSEASATENADWRAGAVMPLISAPTTPRVTGALTRPARRPLATLDGFVVGHSNRLAHSSALVAADEPGRYSPLLVHGATGVGKTHLLEGILNRARKRKPGLHAVHLTAEQFTTHFVEAYNGRGLPSFRRKYRGIELLLVDDLQFFHKKAGTLGELVHTVDTLLREGRQLVFSADRSPAELRHILGEELPTRLSGGIICPIEPPDFQTRLGVLRQIASRIAFDLSDDVAEYIATHLTTHARELFGAINRLEAANRMSRAPVTLAVAEESLAEMIRHQMRPVRLADIDRAVCDVFGLEKEALQSGRRTKTVSHSRMLAMFLARKHTQAALTEIGQHFGRRSHSTVISAYKSVAGLLADQATIEVTGRPWNVEEAIRKVEEKLRAG